MSTRKSRALALLAVLVVVVAVIALTRQSGNGSGHTAQASGPGIFTPTAAQWATFTTVPVSERVFRSELITEGKIAVNDDRATLIFSPYSGRVTRLLVSPGDTVERGQPLFVIEATDALQAQNDFISAATARNKAQSQLTLAQTVEKRHRDLYNDKAVALRELEVAETALVTAQNDLRSAETALEAARNRLRILGKTDAEITTFEQTGKISPDTFVNAPIAGTIVQRKVGPGQLVNAGASDPVFVIGDLSTVWLVAFVRETEALRIRSGQDVTFRILAQPDELYRGNISYIAATLDPNSRRLLIRATIPNANHYLKPEMFATVSIFVDEGDLSLAVPRDAVIYEGSSARVWVANKDKSLGLRPVTPGVTDGGMVQILDGLKRGEEVVTKGSLFIDRAAVAAN